MRIAALFLAIALAGCAENQFAASLFYLTPYNIENKTCPQLKGDIAVFDARLKDYRRLRDKSALSAGGSAVGTVAYGPDYDRAAWDLKVYQLEYARKNCTDAPPTAGPAGAPPAAGPPAPPNAAQPTTVVPR